MARKELKCLRFLPKENLKRNCNRKNSMLNKLIEEETAIPLDKQPDILREIFPENILQGIFHILNIKDEKKIKSSIHAETSNIEIENKYENEPKTVGKANPYLNFFKRGKNADVWNTREKWYQQEFSNFSEKSDAETEKIAVEFVEWMKSQTENICASTAVFLEKKQSNQFEHVIQEPKYMALKDVKLLFDVVPKIEITTSLVKFVKELPIVPKYVALVRKYTEKDSSVCLKKALNKEKIMSMHQIKPVAFSACLPNKLKSCYSKRKTNFIQFIPNEYQKRLMSVQDFLKGIDDLFITKKYINFTKNLPSTKLPRFYVKKHLIPTYFSELVVPSK